MKIRSGFVSNSSSSSFILAWKPERTEDDLYLMFREVCGIPFESPVHGIYEQIFNTLTSNVEEKFDSVEDYMEYTKNNCYFMDDYKEILPLLKNGFVIRFGHVSTGTSDPIEFFLANNNLNYTSDDFIIIHEGSY